MHHRRHLYLWLRRLSRRTRERKSLSVLRGGLRVEWEVRDTVFLQTSPTTARGPRWAACWGPLNEREAKADVGSCKVVSAKGRHGEKMVRMSDEDGGTRRGVARTEIRTITTRNRHGTKARLHRTRTHRDFLCLSQAGDHLSPEERRGVVFFSGAPGALFMGALEEAVEFGCESGRLVSQRSRE